MSKALMVHQRLLETFGHPQWRNPKPPLDELVSTILSQNTNDANRDKAFKNLRTRFPSWEKVRDADIHSLIDAIRPAGLANQKAPRIQAILREISTQRGQLDLGFLHDLPPKAVFQRLIQFKGVGPKTAAIVMLFALGIPAFPVDTHIYRVAGRLGLRPDKVNREKAQEYLEKQFPPEAYCAAHLNIIRLGRTICQARRPLCPRCPLQDICDFAAEHPDLSQGQPA
ncbi:MAG: endonuclease III [Chloroflexota bacterium]